MTGEGRYELLRRMELRFPVAPFVSLSFLFAAAEGPDARSYSRLGRRARIPPFEDSHMTMDA